jgi:subtilase family protein/PA domain-containing protein/fibronectin type III domain protein
MPRGAFRRRLSGLFRLSVPIAAVVLATAASPVAAGPTATIDPSTLTATELSPDSTFTASKSDDIAVTDPSLLGLTSSDPINVMIKYSYASTASYAGGVDGLAPTSPRKTGKALKDNSQAVQQYETYIKGKENQTSAAIVAAVPAASIDTSYTTVYGGVSATVPANQVATLLMVPGVDAVQKDSLQQPLAQDDATTFVGAAAVWPSLGGEAHAGQGVLIGLLDTGVWPESPFFADNAGLPAPVAPHACQFGDGSDTAHLGPTFDCNHKLVGAYAFTHTYLTAHGSDGAAEFCNQTALTCSARDSEGHGTHTASTAAGDLVTNAVMYGVDRGPVSGMAPGAEVIEYRVCLSAGCFSSDMVAAVQQAIHDGINVLSFSISGGANPYTDAVELAFLDAFNAGVTVSASAGNNGPGSATTDHGGPWVITVGASTSDRFFTSTLNLAADNGDTFSMPGVTITNGITSATPVVLAETLPGEDALCQKQLASGAAAGKVVACKRGTNARVDKGYNVSLGGAAGMILYNPVNQDVETDNHWLPAIHVNGPSTGLLSFINGHTGVTATWAQGTPSPTTGDVMAAFSSRGPSAFFLKPDITAPGIQVLAGMTPQPHGTVNGPPGNLFQAIAGTSMSAPHVAGSVVLVKAAHPDWTPAEIKSALMTSAAQGVVKEDGTTPATPFDDGAGSLRVNRAVSPTLVFDETFTDYVASSADPLGRVNLNLPSVDAPTMSGQLTTTRTAVNVSGVDQRLHVSVDQPAGTAITVNGKNKDIKIDAGASVTFSITISAPFAANGQYFGRITLTPSSGNAVTIPVAFNKHQGAVTLTQSCTPTTIAVSATSHCSATASNLAPTAASVALSVQTEKSLHFQNTSGATSVSPHAVSWSGSLTPAIPPQVLSITQGGTPAPYVPLALFKVAPIPGVGDDTITNFNTPSFSYGGENYTRVGVVSNGYVVVGGGTSADIVFRPQIFPNPARPNNVIAPLWTDLNPSSTGGGSLRIATLTNGTDTWLVVDWSQVKNFGNSATNSFEVWLRLGSTPASEQVSMVYGADVSSGDAASGANSGAENRDGTSGQNIPAPGHNTQWRVNLSGPTPGGHQTLEYDLSSDEAGTFTSTASMTSNLTSGTTQVPVIITVN